MDPKIKNYTDADEASVSPFVNNRKVNIFTDDEGNPHVYITENIGSVVEYLGVIRLLNTVPDDVIVHLHINTVGGDMNTTTQIKHNMKLCKAKIIGHVEGGVSSAGTVLILACDDYVVADNASFMCHYYSSGYVGKGQDLEAYAEHAKDKYRTFFRKEYKGFLSKKEITKLLNGTDIWISSEDLRERLHSFKEYRIKQEAKALFKQQEKLKEDELERVLEYAEVIQNTPNRTVDEFISLIKGEHISPTVHNNWEEVIEESTDEEIVMAEEDSNDEWVSLSKKDKVKRKYKPIKTKR